MKKKLLSVLVALAMMMTILPATAMAADAAAKVGEVEFGTLAEAVDAAEAGATVTLLKDDSGAGMIIDKDLTIDFGGFTYTFTSGVGSTGTESNGLQILQGNTVVLKNGELNIAEANKTLFYILVQNYADLTVKDMVLDATYADKWSGTDGDSYALSINCGSVEVTGNTSIIANDEGALAYSVDVCKYASYPAPEVTIETSGTINGKLSVTGGELTVDAGTFHARMVDDVYNDTDVFVVSSGLLTINDADVDGGDVEDTTAVWTMSGGKAVINGGIYTLSGKNVSSGHNDMIYAGKQNDADKGGIVEIYGGEFSATDVTDPGTNGANVWLLNEKDNQGELTVYGGSFEAFNPAEVYTEPSQPTSFVPEGWTVTVDNSVYTVADGRVAAIGNTKYATLASAIEAAGNGATVTLLESTSGAGVIIDKDITIDFDGNTYTFTSGVGSTGTESNGFQILTGNEVVLKNGELNIAEASKALFYILVQNYADLTLEDMTLDATYADKWSTDADQEVNGDSYALSINSGTVNLEGDTNIIANDEGSKAYAFDVCEYSTYAAPEVTVDITGLISGKMDTSSIAKDDGDQESGSLVIKNGSFTVCPADEFVYAGEAGDNYIILTDENEGIYIVGNFAKLTVNYWASNVTEEFVAMGAVLNIENPVRTGYTFAGWYTDAEYTTAFDKNQAVSGDITLYAKWTQNTSSSTSSGSSGNTTTSVEKNDDGSTTTTTTNKATGAVTETTKTPDGVTGTVVTDKNGNVTEVSAKVPASAAKDEEPVALPVELSAADSTEEAEAVKIDVPSGGATVMIPVDNSTAGTVVVIVHADGTGEIVKNSMAVEDGVVVTLEEDATVKVIDNSKDFVDVTEDSTFADAIDYMTSHELMNGVGDGTKFDGNAPTTRAMVWTIIGRGEDADLYGAGVFDKAGEWAIENGVSDGSNPNGAVSRQQLAVMLWRAAGEPVSNQTLDSFRDNGNVADYAKMALAWAVENNIMQGNNGNLNPAGNATRNHVAAMYMRYMQAMNEA